MMNFMSGTRPGFYEDEEDEGSSEGMNMNMNPSSHYSFFPSSSSELQRGVLPNYASSPTNNGDADETNDSIDDHITLRPSSTSMNSIFIEREHMFDKVVTPSDVGKLNRLVIPKQYAEKYFPLDSSTNEKGLLLNFEDRNGKPWRFRYSYWNSSQSYVMTKGWSRFVKEKKLDAGDTVSFQRGVGELGKDRLFIDWRRRPDAMELSSPIPPPLLPHQVSFHHRTGLHPWHPPPPPPPPPPLYFHPRNYSHVIQPNVNSSYGPYTYSGNHVITGNPCSAGSIVYVRSGGGPRPGQLGPVQIQRGGGGGLGGGGGGGGGGVVFESVPVVQGKAAAKRLRLFGVNMDCPISESDECDILSSTTVTTTHPTMELYPTLPPFDSSSSSPFSFHQSSKGKGSTTSMSLDLDI